MVSSGFFLDLSTNFLDDPITDLEILVLALAFEAAATASSLFF